MCGSSALAGDQPEMLSLAAPAGVDQESSTAHAPRASDDASTLANQTLNPVADLISVPFQYNLDFNIGPKDATKQTLNIQPVIPISLNENWNLITRTIVPLIHIDSVADGVDSKDGLGDTTQSFFLSPKEPTAGGWIWGAGPVFYWPTGTDGLSGRKWGIGPTAVVLKQEHGWTYGALANHIWSFAGDDHTHNINATFLQPFVSYTFRTHTSITLNTEATYDWNADQATVPVNLLASQILKIGPLPVSLQFGPRYYVEGPSGNADWGLRISLTFLFPK
jgi:hypothetical protein